MSSVSHGYVDMATGTKVVYKTADKTLNNVGVLEADNHLLFPIGASEKCVGQFVLLITGNSTADFQFSLSVPASAAVKYAALAGRASSDAVVISNTVVSAADTAVTVFGSTGVIPVWFSVANSTTAGNVTLNWAQTVATVANTTLYAGSYLVAHRV